MSKSTSRGRPPGSGNRAGGSAAIRAREFIDLLKSGKTSAEAARIVAGKWGVAESTVYHDVKRHTMTEGEVRANMEIIQLAIEETLDAIVDGIVKAVDGIRCEKTIHAIISKVKDHHLDKLGNALPSLTTRSTIGGTMRDGLKKPTKK
jgi:hypothetical protein